MMSYMTSQYRRVEPARLEQREAQRHPVLLGRATVHEDAKETLEARLVDLSVYGCRVSIDGGVKVGERIWLRLANSNPISATAVWAEGNRLGCKFDEMLDRALFRQLTLQGC
ncbi:MAG: PilZ domain-containing protein [Sphingorhabdus sp.]|uniref:PilZ domain-containing protein n=1 Tax=Sphingorhabdus sp. TaxID=1902408 RepID=UPI0038FC0986